MKRTVHNFVLTISAVIVALATTDARARAASVFSPQKARAAAILTVQTLAPRTGPFEPAVAGKFETSTSGGRIRS